MITEVRFDLTIKSRNADVVGDATASVAEMLRNAAEQVEFRREAVIMDVNGNRVGTWALRVAEEVYTLQADYGHGHGWDDVTSEETEEAIRDQLHTYQEEGEAVYRVVKEITRPDGTKKIRKVDV